MDRPELREKIEGLLSQYSSELLAWKGWGINAVEKTHDLKVQIAKEIEALIPDIEESEARLELVRRLMDRCEQLRGEAKEAKKQERERIIERAERLIGTTTNSEWQTLKEE